MGAGRRVAAALATVLLVAALAGCAAGVPLTNTAVLTVNASRLRYLDAMCPLRATDAFWTPAGGPAAASAELAAAAPAVRTLADPPKPYPRLLAPSMARLVAVLEDNRAYFAKAAAAPDAAAVRALTAPAAEPDAAIEAVESIVTATAAPGSPGCVDHLPATASPAPSDS